MKNNFFKNKNLYGKKISLVLTLFILFNLGVITGSIILITLEIKEAKFECKNISGNYTLNFIRGHLCNNEKFFKQNVCLYNKCHVAWTFGKPINVSEFLR